MRADLLIKNVEIIDGTGGPAFFGAIAVKDEKILAVYKALESSDAAVGTCEGADASAEEEPKYVEYGSELAEIPEADSVMDGHGLTLSPGFIDVHSHGDLVAGHDYARLCKISQGITTEIAGQCGTSCYPVTPESKALLMANVNILGDNQEKCLDKFTNLAGYKEFLENSSLSSNIMVFMGHSALRLAVMGTSDAKPDAKQIARMREYLEEAMQQGCAGLSTGLFYPPSAYADVEEVSALCEVVAKYGGIHTSHIRNEGSEVLESLEEILEVARRTGVQTNVSHHKVCGRKNWGLSEKTLELLESARQEGIHVTMDVYPYLASMTKLAACIPTEYFVKGVAWLQTALKDPAVRMDIREKMESFEDGRYRQCGGFTGVMIGECPTRPDADGKFISEYAAEIGADPFEVFFDMIMENGSKCSAIYFTMSQDDLDRIVSDPHTMIGTDGLVNSLEGKTHPRGWATFPRAIRMFAREKKLLSMEEMVHRITGLAAETYKLPNKGRIEVGYDADLVLFNKEEIGDAADFNHSNLLSTGIEMVLVGGKIAYKDGKMTEEYPGRWLGLGGIR